LSEQNKGLKEIEARKARGEKSRCQRSYFILNFIGLLSKQLSAWCWLLVEV
jgi:hypothetical protein